MRDGMMKRLLKKLMEILSFAIKKDILFPKTNIINRDKPYWVYSNKIKTIERRLK
jgi:hypothetical protein